jgi:hypothetical protein
VWLGGFRADDGRLDEPEDSGRMNPLVTAAICAVVGILSIWIFWWMFCA